MLRKYALMTAALAAILIWPTSPVRAGTLTAQMTVSGNVGPTCTKFLASPMSFASLATGATATSTLTVNCPTSLPYTVSLTAGTCPSRTLIGPSGTAGTSFVYSLFSDAAMTTAFCTAGTTFDQHVVGTGTGLDQLVNVFGKVTGVTAGPAPVTGAYSDTVTASLAF